MKKLTLSLFCAGLISTTAIAESICDAKYLAQDYKQAAVCYIDQQKTKEIK